MVSPVNGQSRVEVNDALRPLLDRLKSGGQVILTDHGRPVARITSMGEAGSKAERAEAVRWIEEFGATHTLGGLDWRALRDEGRR